MKRFDVNCMLGRWPQGGPTLANTDELLASMNRLSIERALVRHTMAIYHDASRGNELLMAELGGHARLEPCWVVLPDTMHEMGEGWIEQMVAQQVRAVAMYPSRQGYPLANWQCDGVLGPLAARRYLLLLEAGEADWHGLHWLCGAHPGLRVVLLGPGYRVLRPLFALLDAHPNLYLDMSTLSNFGGVETVCARFGAQRLVFGTGVPRTEGAGPITALEYSTLTVADLETISAGNLERLLGEVQI